MLKKITLMLNFLSLLVINSLSYAITIQKMNFQNAKLSDVLKTIAQINHESIIFGPKFKDETVNINIAKPIDSNVLLHNILREYCLESSNVNGIIVINSGKCQIQPLPSLSELLKQNNIALPAIKPMTKTETIIIKPNSYKDVNNILKSIKEIYSFYDANKLNVLVITGSPKAIDEVNKKLRSYFVEPPRIGKSMINADLYLYNIDFNNFEKLISPYLSKNAVVIHEVGDKIIIEDYPENLENIVNYFPQYVSLKPKYITKIFFIKNNLNKVYTIAQSCKAKVDKSEQFKALILTGSPKIIAYCEKELLPYTSEAPRQNIIKSQTFYIKYISLDKFDKLIKPYISNKAIITPIKNMDAVTIIDYIQNLENIKKHLKQYISEKPVYIQIDVKAVEITKGYQTQLGLGVGGAYAGRGITLFNTNNFSQTPLANNFTFTPGASPSITSSAVTLPNGLISGIYSEGKFHVLGFEIQALESINKAKSIFKSTLLAMNGQPASLTQGIEYPFTTISTPGQAVPTVTLQNVLNSIKVTPQILPNNKILLNVNLQNMSLGPLAANGQPTINQNSNTLSIVLSNGSTLAIGGVGLENKNSTLQGIPGLDKVPVLGAVGMNKNKNSTHTNLFIFITAKRVEK